MISVKAGLKDKNGKDICNNDVLENKCGDIIIVDTNDYLIMNVLKNMDVKVIGNICENKKLLK